MGRQDLGTDFVDAHAEQIDKVFDSGNGLYLIAQVVGVGPNGAFRTNDVDHLKTSLSRRQQQITITNDLFYNMNDTELAEQNAIDWTTEFSETLIESKLFSDSDMRMTWATFGDLDISSAWQYYYDSEAVYERLIDVKTKVDPTNIFRHEFTIPVRSQEPMTTISEEAMTTMSEHKSGVATNKVNPFCFFVSVYIILSNY